MGDSQVEVIVQHTEENTQETELETMSEVVIRMQPIDTANENESDDKKNSEAEGKRLVPLATEKDDEQAQLPSKCGLITALLLKKDNSFTTSSQQKKPSSTCDGPTKPPKGEKIIYHYFNLAVIIAQFYTDRVSNWTQKRIKEVDCERLTSAVSVSCSNCRVPKARTVSLIAIGIILLGIILLVLTLWLVQRSGGNE